MMGDQYWHDRELTGDDLARAVWQTVAALATETASLRARWAVAIGYYAASNRADDLVAELGMLSYDHESLRRDDDAPSWNLCRSLPDTIVSHVTFQAPSIKIQTTAQGDIVQREAQQAERFLAGSMREALAAQAWRGALRLATIMGTGWVRTWPDHERGRVMVRCYGPDRVLVDHRIAAYDTPQSQFFLDLVDQSELRARYSGRTKAAQDARAIIDDAAPVLSLSGLRRLVPVIEAVKLGDGETPGRRVVVLRNGVLTDEPYDCPRHRAVAIRYTPPIDGWYGESLVDQVIESQRSMNYATAAIDGNMRHLSHAYISDTTPDAVRMADADLPDQDIAPYRVVPMGGRVETPPIASPQHFAWADKVWAREHEQHGISQLSATAARPAGIESGAALRVLHHSQSKRLSELETACGELWVAMAQCHLDAGSELGAGWKTIVTANRRSQSQSWSGVALQADSYAVSLYPASSLSDDPAGRLAEAGDLMRSGLVDQAEARQLAGMTDLAKSNDLASARRDALEQVFEAILMGEAVDPPSPMHDLAAAVKLGMSYWALAKRDGADPALVDEVERWTVAAMEMLRSSEEPAPQAPSGDAMAADPVAAVALAKAEAMGGNGSQT